MPSHVYHEISLGKVGENIWFSWGEKLGWIVSPKTFIQLFIKEFTFDTRYEVDFDGSDPSPEKTFSYFVSNGGEGKVYVYEIEGLGKYNMPKEGGWDTEIEHNWQGEKPALRQIAKYLLEQCG